MGLGSSGTCLLLLLDILSGPLISLVYPLFATVQAIEKGSSNNNLRPVLTYWVLYSLIALFELVFASVLEWIPIWSIVKTTVNCLLIPNNGSNVASNFEDGSAYNGFRGGRSTYNGYDNRSYSHIYDDRSSSSRRVRGYNNYED